MRNLSGVSIAVFAALLAVLAIGAQAHHSFAQPATGTRTVTASSVASSSGTPWG